MSSRIQGHSQAQSKPLATARKWGGNERARVKIGNIYPVFQQKKQPNFTKEHHSEAVLYIFILGEVRGWEGSNGTGLAGLPEVFRKLSKQWRMTAQHKQVS